MDFPISVPNIGLVAGKFVDENPLLGTPGSLIPSAWGNAITQEVLNVIAAAGLAPSEADVTQLLKAIRTINQSASSTFGQDIGATNAAVVNLTPAVTSLVDGMVIRVNMVSGNNGPATLNLNGLGVKNISGLGGVALQGGELTLGGRATLMWANTQNTWILLSCQAGSLAIAPATASRHAVQFSQLGNYNGVTFTSTNTTLTAALLGKPIVVNVGGTTQTLPASATLLPGSTFIIAAFGSTTVKGNAAEQITNQFGVAANTLVMNAGEQISLTTNATGWYVSSYSQAVVGAPIGTASNVKMSVATASALATLTADEVIVGTALGGKTYRLSGFSNAINLGITGPAGMDTGSAPVNGYVALYAIYNPTTGTSSLIAVNATAAVMPAVYGGANMPSGFTASALISVWPTTAASLLAVGFQTGRKVSGLQVQVLNTATQQASLTTIAITSAVPQNAKMCSCLMSCTSTLSASITTVIAGSATGIGQRNMSISPSTGINLSAADVPLVAPQNINYLATVTAGTMSLQIYVTDYTF